MKKNFILSFLLALGVTGWILAIAQVRAKKTVELTLQVEEDSYYHAVDLCQSYMKDSKGKLFGDTVVRVEGELITLPCRLIVRKGRE